MKEKVQPKKLGKVIHRDVSKDGKDELVIFGSIFKERPQVQVMTWRKGQEDENEMATPYYGSYGWDLVSISNGKFAYEVFYDDIFGGIIRANNMEAAKLVAIDHKNSKFYFCDKQATIKIQRVKFADERIYDTQGVITNAKPRKSATLVK